MQTDELVLRQLIASTSVLTLLGLHLFVLLYGSLGKRRGLRTAAGYLFALDWALMMGVTAGRTVASDNTLFWSVHTMKWGALGVLVLFLPVWLLFRQGLRFSGTFLLPVMPTQSKQRRQAGRTVRAYMWGLNYPSYREEDGELLKVLDGGISLREGGPGFVMAGSHYAIPLTVGTHDTQVGGHGLVFTGRKERSLSLVDLRLQVRAKSVHALTREGIPVKAMMFAVFQIDRRRAQDEGTHPFDPEAVFAAVHARGIGPGPEEEQEEMGWDRVVVGRAADLLRDVIARTLLDRLLESESEDAPPPRETLRSEVAEELKEAMRPLGIEVLGLGLGNIEVEDKAVLEQRVHSWAARWERRRLEREAEGDAEATRLIEEARADAQRHMIEAITEAFQQLADTGTSVPPHVIALRFIDVLDEMAASPGVQQWLPAAARGVPDRLRLLMEPGSTSDEPGDEGGATR